MNSDSSGPASTFRKACLVAYWTIELDLHWILPGFLYIFLNLVELQRTRKTKDRLRVTGTVHVNETEFNFSDSSIYDSLN